ncbi:MAG: hypothetical protein IH991_03870 [Planctomycetes bacterium]|nr:hypothetical protein [Planctomycetota bacterium]
MHRFLVTTFWMLSGSLLLVGFHSHVRGAKSADDADAAAVAAIKKIGGSVRRIAVNNEDREVEFHLRGRELTDEGLVHVARLKNVVLLHLKDTKITNAGLVYLKGLTQLRELHLENTEIGDPGIVHLNNLANLEYLNLYATNVTDKALEHLAGLKKLKRLYLWKTEVTDEGVARLEKSLPELTIQRGADISEWSIPVNKPPVPLKWIAAAGDAKPPKSASGSNTLVIFENKSDRRVKIYWVDYGGNLKLYDELDPGKTRNQNTYANNTWLITDENDKPLGHFIAEPEESRAVIPKQK